MSVRAHLAEALRWSAGGADRTAIIAGAAGVVAPILIGAVTGQLGHGFAVALGGMMIGGVNAGRDWREQARDLAMVLLAAVSAAAIAASISGADWRTDAIVIALAAATGFVGGMSRVTARIAMQFTLYLLIAVTVLETAPHRFLFAGLMLCGMVGAIAVNLVGGAVARARGHAVVDPEERPEPTWPQRFRRWRRSLGTLAGWQYVLRLTLCLAVAALLRWWWPDHHLRWIALTVALLAERQIDVFPVRTTQRALGTFAGVLVAFAVARAPVWAALAGVAVLAAARPWLRARNYLAYSVLMTPLIMILMDGGQPVASVVLADRLVATLAGAVLVVAANFAFARLVPAPERG